MDNALQIGFSSPGSAGLAPADPPLIEGGILFGDSEGLVAQDAPNLFYDDTNDRLGVGTNAPEAGVHILGADDLQATELLRIEGAAGNGGWSIRASNEIYQDNQRFITTNTNVVNKEGFSIGFRIDNTTGSSSVTPQNGIAIGIGLDIVNSFVSYNNQIWLARDSTPRMVNYGAPGDAAAVILGRNLLWGSSGTSGHAGSHYLIGSDMEQKNHMNGGTSHVYQMGYNYTVTGPGIAGTYFTTYDHEFTWDSVQIKREAAGLHFLANDINILSIGQSPTFGNPAFDPLSSNILAIKNGTAPTTAPADTLQIYSTDLSAGNTMLGLRTEGTPIGGGTPSATNTLALEVNGTIYYLLASTSAT